MKLYRVLATLSLPFFLAGVSMAARHSSGSRTYYGGSHHTESHGGTYRGGSGSSHKGGHYTSPTGSHSYGRHR